MEGLIGDEDEEEDGDEASANAELEERSLSPSQPVLLSQKADLLQDALQSQRENLDLADAVSDIDQILGEDSAPGTA